MRCFQVLRRACDDSFIMAERAVGQIHYPANFPRRDQPAKKTARSKSLTRVTSNLS